MLGIYFAAVRNIGQHEFIALEQGEMSITEYGQEFLGIYSFWTHINFSEAMKGRTFKS